MSLLHNLDPTWYWMVLAPVSIAIAAWALRVACALSSVACPNFWEAVVLVVVLGIVNGILQYAFHFTNADATLAMEIAVAVVTTVAILCLSLSTGPCTALMITVIQVSICGACYLTLTALDGLVLATG